MKQSKGGIKPGATAARTQLLYTGHLLFQLSYHSAMEGRFLVHSFARASGAQDTNKTEVR